TRRELRAVQEPVGLLGDPDDVGVPGHRPERVLDVAGVPVDRIFAAQQRPGVVGIAVLRIGVVADDVECGEVCRHGDPRAGAAESSLRRASTSTIGFRTVRPPMSDLTAWRRCSACKNPIALGATYWVCSVSTCNQKRTGLAFCTVSCWDAHLPVARHREAWAEERTAPARAEASGSAPGGGGETHQRLGAA